MHLHRTTIRLHDTDAAGVVYFASALRLAHEAYEAALDAAGFPLAGVLREGAFALPIVHAEADFLAPLCVGDGVEIRVGLKSLGPNSFALAYRLTADGGRVAATAETVHAVLRLASGKVAPVPAALKKALRALGPP
jgi:1,4-dihydroxy-2-naphthoyl-CoA hydrolase